MASEKEYNFLIGITYPFTPKTTNPWKYLIKKSPNKMWHYLYFKLNYLNTVLNLNKV